MTPRNKHVPSMDSDRFVSDASDRSERRLWTQQKKREIEQGTKYMNKVRGSREGSPMTSKYAPLNAQAISKPLQVNPKPSQVDPKPSQVKQKPPQAAAKFPQATVPPTPKLPQSKTPESSSVSSKLGSRDSSSRRLPNVFDHDSVRGTGRTMLPTTTESAHDSRPSVTGTSARTEDNGQSNNKKPLPNRLSDEDELKCLGLVKPMADPSEGWTRHRGTAIVYKANSPQTEQLKRSRQVSEENSPMKRSSFGIKTDLPNAQTTPPANSIASSSNISPALRGGLEGRISSKESLSLNRGAGVSNMSSSTLPEAVIRRVRITNLPQNFPANELKRIIWGGPLEAIQYNESDTRAEALFISAEDCKKYYKDTVCGIRVPYATGGDVQTTLSETPDPVSDTLKLYVKRECTRVVCMRSPPAQLNPAKAYELATGNSQPPRKLEELSRSKQSDETFQVDWRFCKLEDAVKFKQDLQWNPDFADCEVSFEKDPCDRPNATMTGRN